MLREFTSMISLLAAILMGGYAAVLAVSILFNLGGLRRPGTNSTLDADWPTVACLALFALLSAGLFWLTTRKPAGPGGE